MRQASASPAAAALSTWAGRPLHLQRKCSCGASTAEGECESCKSKKLQRRAAVGADDHPLEAEADRAAAAVLAGGAPPPLTRMAGGGASEVPESVLRTLARGGQPLAGGTRRFMERRFGADFGAVRVHQDGQAAQSAREVQARAYTVGSHIVFGAGEDSSPRSPLLAHELAHTVQQGGSPRQLQRACLPDAECKEEKAGGGALEDSVRDTEKKPENASKADKRKKACEKTPPDPACKQDGHAAVATTLTALLKEHYASRLAQVTGIYVNKDNPADWAAVTTNCSNFMPPLPGDQCTFVPDTMEAEAKLYRGGSKSVGGLSRARWLTKTLGALTHETEHGRYSTGAGVSIAEPDPAACKFADHKTDLSELSAHLSEMHVFYREALSVPAKGRFDRFNAMFNFWVDEPTQGIAKLLKNLRCHCECAHADHYVVEASRNVMADQKWDSNEKFTVHAQLADPKRKLKWPIDPKSIAVNLNDMPDETAVPFKLE